MFKIKMAMPSAGVGCLLMTTSVSPRKYRSSPAAGYTAKLVPPTIKVSATEIALIAFSIVASSSPSSYSTTSGFTMPPHSVQRGTPSPCPAASSIKLTG